jgi:hypothetical protein
MKFVLISVLAFGFSASAVPSTDSIGADEIVFQSLQQRSEGSVRTLEGNVSKAPSQSHHCCSHCILNGALSEDLASLNPALKNVRSCFGLVLGLRLSVHRNGAKPEKTVMNADETHIHGQSVGRRWTLLPAASGRVAESLDAITAEAASRDQCSRAGQPGRLSFQKALVGVMRPNPEPSERTSFA